MIGQLEKAKLRMLKTKSQRKMKLIKKAEELSRICGTKIDVIIYDEKVNMLQEFKSCEQFNSEWITKHKKNNSNHIVNT